MGNDDLKAADVGNIIKVDACGMQCPGPIMRLSESMQALKEDDILEITSTDPGFQTDVGAWCEMTGNTLLQLCSKDGIIKAIILKGENSNNIQIPECSKKVSNPKSGNPQTIVMFSNDLDKALAALIIANGAVSAGKPVTLFFTFWGLNILRRRYSEPVKKSLIDKMFCLMMPKGAEKLVLSKMNMGGIGSSLMKYVMKKKNVLSLAQLIQEAKNNGVKFIACSMSMDIMGIKKEELIDGVEIGGVAKYIAESDKASSNLFI